jgi:hypothetical protein
MGSNAEICSTLDAADEFVSDNRKRIKINGTGEPQLNEYNFFEMCF